MLPRQTYEIDETASRTAWKALEDAGSEGDTTWVDALPTDPGIPVAHDDTVALLPTRPARS